MKSRPTLTSSLSPSEFKEFYWEKKELIAFCKKEALPTSGGKIELTERIAFFLETGKTLPSKTKEKSGARDSSSEITLTTPVINYNNDAITREFFKSYLGEKFKFNHFLREFAKQTNDGSLTYEDLVEGYKQSLSNPKKTIDPQFQYNQFCRDFYANEKGKTKADLAKAWQLVRSAPGDATYAHYLELI